MSKHSPQHKILYILALTICALSAPPTANAQNNTIDIMPAKSINSANIEIDETKHTHPPLRLTPDKSEIITLDHDAASIIIGNPNHLSILTDSSKRLVLVPRAPGASYFTILDRDGNVIMQRHAIIASPKKQYVRIRRSCAGEKSDNCQQTRVFYCPDMCHEIMIDTQEAEKDAGAADTAAANNNQTEPLDEETE